jgi:exodeoxyribonuclease VII large subunit
MDQMQRLDDVSDRLHQSMGRLLQKKALLLQMQRRALPDPKAKVSQSLSLLKSLELRLLRSGKEIPTLRRRAVESVQSLLDSLSPLRVLDRGYAIIRQKQRVIADIKDLDAKQSIQIQLRDGQVNVEIKV